MPDNKVILKSIEMALQPVTINNCDTAQIDVIDGIL
jgi:hypothetical protein